MYIIPYNCYYVSFVIYKAMLKLSHSFCRYTHLTCENLHYNTVHIKKYTHLTYTRTCGILNYQLFINPFVIFGVRGRLFANIKECNQVKKAGRKILRKMSEPLHPTVHHASCGGQFKVEEDNAEPRPGTSSSFKDELANPHGGALPPNYRVWELVDTWRSSYTTEKTLKFRVVSYNVLAQYLLENHPHLYTECDPKNLKWPVRCAKLFEEIMHLAPDILCLQEVQASDLNCYCMHFERLGYDGLFKQRRQRGDGCAIFIKKSQFEIKDQNTVEYYQPDMPILNRDNVGLMVKLIPRGSQGTPLVVATTHLLYNPQRTDVRLAQMQVLLAEIDRFAFFDNGREWGYLPTIMTGDFNSKPGSPLISLLDQGYLRAAAYRNLRYDWRKLGITDNCQHLSVYLSRQTCQNNTNFDITGIYNSDYSMSMPKGRLADETWDYDEMFNAEDICQPFRLISVYDTVKPDGSPEATTYQHQWVTVDYMYFTKNTRLKLIERLRLPTRKECKSLGRLPNDIYGSDHLAVAATFALTPKTLR